MKENDENIDDKNENENLNENLYEITNEENNCKDKIRDSLVTNQINPIYEGNRLMSLEEKLKLDVPFAISTENINESMDLDILIYNIKDFIIMFILLLSSSFNFNYLYLPFIFIGIFYCCLLLENKTNKRNQKFILEIIVFIYSFLLLIFKIVILVLISKGNEFILEHKNIFIDLGISYLLSDKEKMFFTFIGESLTFLFSLAGIIINKVTVITDEEIESRFFKKLTFDVLFIVMRKYLYTCFFIIAGIAVFNKSILSIIYIIPMCIILFLYSIEIDRTIIYHLFRIVVNTLLYLLILEILIINFTNFYSIAYKFFLETDDNTNFIIIFRQLGFYFIYYKENENELYLNWLGYSFSCLSLTTYSLCSKAISKHELQIAKKKGDKDEEDKTKQKKFINIFYDKLAVIFLNPYYIMHVCRIMAIIWIYSFRNFYSLGIFIWLFFSFIYLHITSNEFWSKFVLIPCISISFFSIHISRIDGVFEFNSQEKRIKYLHFALGKYDSDYLRYIFSIFFYFFSNYFIYTLSEFKNEIIKKAPLPHFEQKNIVDNLMKETNEEKKINSPEEDIDYNKNNKDIFSDGINVLDETTIDNKIIFNKDLENIKEDEELKEEELNEITLKNLIVKFFFYNIDKITLISMYLAAFNEINILNFIILICFMSQLLYPEFTKMISIGIIILFQFLYLIEYIMDLTKVYNSEFFKENIEIIQILLPYNEDLDETSVEIFIYFIVYCFYAQYELYNYKEYQELEDKENINIKNYINIICKDYPFLKSLLLLFRTIIINMYVWVIVLLFIFCSCIEVNLLFGIKLGLFLISLYFLMLFIQDPVKRKLTIKSSILVLVYSGINTFVVYLYQILYYLLNLENNLNHSFCHIFSNIGFTKYKDQLYIKLFPHFFSSFLSFLFVIEMKRTIKVNEKKLLDKYLKEQKTLKNSRMEIEKDIKKEEKKESAAVKYQKNLEKMNVLEIKNFFFNIIMIITQFYWLFLFMTVCIFFTTNSLSYGMIIYLIIFGLTFISTFYKTVRKLSNFINKDSYFISKVIRYSLIEVKAHNKRNTNSRKKAFQFLFGINCFFLFILYLSAIFDLFEKVCNPESCDCIKKKNYQSFSSDNNEYKNNIIISISYLFGFYIHSGKLSAAWANLILFCMIAFDVYVQKLENYFTKLSFENRKEFKILANENIKLKPLSLLGETNIIANIESSILSKSLKKAKTQQITTNINTEEDENNENKKDEKDNKDIEALNSSKQYLEYLEEKYKSLFENIESIFINKRIILSNKEKNLGKKNIILFLEIFKKAISSDVKLSETNNKYKIIKGIKEVYEEIIIFLLICTAISKLNIWSFIYMIFALYLILTKKSVQKFYSLFCFLIWAIIFQNSIFVSNISMETDPGQSKRILSLINESLNIPWYPKYTDDKNGFFLGLGVNKMQINLMWMDYIEAIIIYIYLTYFSYSIYQNVQNKGKVSKGIDKINYYNLHLKEKVRKCVETLNVKAFKKHQKCMKCDFNIELGEFEEFKNKILLIKPVIELKDMNRNLMNSYNTVNNVDINIKNYNKDNTEYIPLNILTNNQNEENDKKDLNNDNNEAESPLLLALQKSKKLASTKKNLISKTMDTKDESSSCFDKFKKIIYLSSHNVILIIIMIISMMVSGILSIFYITFSLIFLMKSNSMYVGDPYYYPKIIKTVLRVAILIDIAIQTLYQTPYINTGTTNNKLFIILKIIGFNKIINFGENFNAKEFEIFPDQMILVLAKAFTYFFMSIQILIYSSQDFQEYYLSYLLTKNIHLRKRSLMNVFRFNNERIEVMGKSISLRQEMDNSMFNLQKKLESWNRSLSFKEEKTNLNLKKKKSKKARKSSIFAIEEDKKEKEKKDENINNNNENIIDNYKRAIEIEEKEIEKQLNDKKEEKENTENNNNDDIIKIDANKSIQILGEKEEEEKEEEEEEEEEESENEEIKIKKYLPENIVKEQIKSWIFGGILMKIQLWLHKNTASYTSIDIDEREVYEKEVIQGRTTISSMLETMVELQLNTIDLSKFTSNELREVKTYFDGTREKELLKLKKEKEKIEKLKKKGNQLKIINQLKKEITKGKIEEENKEEKKEENSEEINKRRDKKDGKRLSFYEDIKLKEEENKKYIKDITPKFKELEKFTSNELFVKYLKTNYIIKCIIIDIIAFCSNQFHWLCYSIMIIDYMTNPSLISLFYPLSIFLFAIMEYPRPRKTYWNICLLYTVILITIKYIIQLQLFVTIFQDENNKDASGKIINPYKEFIEKIQHYKVGFLFFDSTFSLSFFSYIICDSLVIIFLLINNYLLLSKGIWLKREQEIENIYQAMERIASTKHLKLTTIQETKTFNSKWLYSTITSKNTIKQTPGLFPKEYSTSGKNEKKAKKLIVNKTQQMPEKLNENKENKDEYENKNEINTRKKSPSFYQKISEYKKNHLDAINKKNEEIMKPIYLEKYNEKNKNYYQRLFPTIRNEKPGHEYYFSYTMTMFSIIIFLILFYTNMNQDKTFNSLTVETNQFSSSMVIFLIVHVIFLVYDRVIYISQNRNNLIYDYIIYDKKTCSPITEAQFNQIKSDISLQYHNIKRDTFVIPTEYIDKLKDKYNIVYIQNEEFNFPLLQKYILHLIITIFSHVFVCFYLPMKGNYNIGNAIYCIEDNDCNDFTYNPLIIIFYILYVIYLIGSGLQVKYGFYDLKRKSILKTGNSSINGGIYAAFKAIPFLYELKLAIDWTFTSTCLDLFQWNKFESVYDTIYSTYCSMTAKNSQLIGQKVKKIMKIGLGGTLSFTLILLLVVPIMLFSGLNPTNELNNLLGATLKIDLSILYKNGATKNYTLFENSKPQAIKNLFPDEKEEWVDYKYSESIETKNFPHEQIQKVEFFKESDRNWGLAKPHILNLINTFGDLVDNKTLDINKIYIVMDYVFERHLPPEAKKASNRIDTIIYEDKNQEDNITQIEVIEQIKNVLIKCNDKYTVRFKDLYSVPLRLTANVNPRIIYDENYNDYFNYDVILGFIGCEQDENNETTYLESYFTLEKVKNNKTDGGLIFHIFSDKVSSSTSGYSVITFYVSLVLLAGTYVRNFFSGEAEKIKLTELPNPESLINLCEGILVSRYSFDYEQEEKLYYILMELMRSPDYLKILTESSIEQFKKRRELTIREKDNRALKIE